MLDSLNNFLQNFHQRVIELMYVSISLCVQQEQRKKLNRTTLGNINYMATILNVLSYLTVLLSTAQSTPVEAKTIYKFCNVTGIFIC